MQPHRHGARGRNQQRKAIDLGFEIAAEQVQPVVLRLAGELFALGRTFVIGAGLALKVMDHLMNENPSRVRNVRNAPQRDGTMMDIK